MLRYLPLMLHMDIPPRSEKEPMPNTENTTTITEEVLDDIPDGLTFPLNSKQLNTTQI